MYKCNDCEREFETPRVETDSHWSPYGYEEEGYGVCPHCGSEDYEEAEKCEECGEWFTKDEMHGCYCKECLKAKINDKSAIGFAIETGDLESLFESVLTKTEIDSIMVDAIKAKVRLHGASFKNMADFVMDDADCFSDFISRKGA